VRVGGTVAPDNVDVFVQSDRRNLSGKELAGFVARAMETPDRVKPAGGDRRSDDFKASIDALNGGKLAAQTAGKIGVSTKQVGRVRKVLASGDEARSGRIIHRVR
jgi:hypothetical protein